MVGARGEGEQGGSVMSGYASDEEAGYKDDRETATRAQGGGEIGVGEERSGWGRGDRGGGGARASWLVWKGGGGGGGDRGGKEMEDVALASRGPLGEGEGGGMGNCGGGSVNEVTLQRILKGASIPKNVESNSEEEEDGGKEKEQRRR